MSCIWNALHHELLPLCFSWINNSWTCISFDFCRQQYFIVIITLRLRHSLWKGRSQFYLEASILSEELSIQSPFASRSKSGMYCKSDIYKSVLLKAPGDSFQCDILWTKLFNISVEVCGILNKQETVCQRLVCSFIANYSPFTSLHA